MKTIKKVFSYISFIVLLPLTAVIGFSIAMPAYLVGVIAGFSWSGLSIGFEYALRIALNVAKSDKGDTYKP